MWFNGTRSRPIASTSAAMVGLLAQSSTVYIKSTVDFSGTKIGWRCRGCRGDRCCLELRIRSHVGMVVSSKNMYATPVRAWHAGMTSRQRESDNILPVAL